MADVRLSVVVPCFNEAGTIGHQLRALAGQEVDFGWEVIVADNGSKDETREVVRQFDTLLPGLRVVSAGGRRGAAHARNAGARASVGEWLVFCDADDVVGEGWLDAMGRALSRHDVVVPRFEGASLNPDSPFRPLGQQDDVDILWYPPYLKHSGGSGIGVAKSHHDQIGGFDESLLQCEDTDYCVRLQLAGFDIHFASDALLHIRYPEGGGRLFRQARQWARANTTIYRRYGEHGLVTGHAWRAVGSGIWRNLRKWKRMRSAEVRARVTWEAGWHLGLIEGAVTHRVAPVAHGAGTPSRGGEASRG